MKVEISQTRDLKLNNVTQTWLYATDFKKTVKEGRTDQGQQEPETATR